MPVFDTIIKTAHSQRTFYKMYHSNDLIGIYTLVAKENHQIQRDLLNRSPTNNGVTGDTVIFFILQPIAMA